MATNWAFVLFPGEDLWHQRRVLGRVALSVSEFVIVTPDHDVYMEDYADDNEDVSAVRWANAWDHVPLGVPAARVYRFAAAPDEAAVVGYMQDGEFEAARLCREHAARMGRPELLEGLRALAPLRAGSVRAVAVRPDMGVLRGACAAARAARPQFVWRVACAGGGYSYGDPVEHVATAAAVGEMDIHVLPSGEGLFVVRVALEDESGFMGRACDADARILPVRRNRAGRREITWSELVEKVSQEDFGKDWSLPGPRTAMCCIIFIHNEGRGGLQGHHERFKTLCRLEPHSWGVQEHFNICMFLHWLLLVDQCDGSNLVASEAGFRRLQTIEFSYQEKARERDPGGGNRLTLEEQYAFSGTTRTASDLMVCPELLEYVRKEVEREASFAKNLVRAREEKDKLRKATKGKGKQQKEDDG